MLPGTPFCILANGLFNVSRIQQFQNYLQGAPLQRNWFVYLFFWSNTAPGTLSATQTWKLFLTNTPRLDEAFGLERFSASTPEKLSNLGAFKVPEMIRSGDLS